MSSFSRGVADAMLDSRASGAESAAAFAAADADHARRMLREANSTADRQVAEWRAYAKEFEDALRERNAQASGAFILINGMLRAMEGLPPGQREQFRQTMVQYARGRMMELDAKNKAEKNDRLSIVEAFAPIDVNKKLGVV